MSLTVGARIGPYEVVAKIGEGGMGQVYRATDTSLGRQVAIKVLPEAIAQDPERVARFEREARTLASLDHPNIAIVHGLESSPGGIALVMELVEGPTLADRLASGAMLIDEVLPIARQIAEALESAHEQGIVHRDLKPANVKVRPDGTVKVLDFGLAKAMEPHPVGRDFSPAGRAGSEDPAHVPPSQAPTLTSPALMTGAGVILGTAAYMSPEQASGKPVDKRSDIWSFGVVVWEMLTGRRLFEGETVSHTLADVLRAPLPFADIPAGTPLPVRTLVERCLNRDVRARLRDIGEARYTLQQAIERPAAGVAAGEPSARPASPARPPLPWIIAGAGVLGAAVAISAFGVAAPAASPEPAPITRFFVPTSPDNPYTTTGGIHLAVSPDGRQVVFLGRAGGAAQGARGGPPGGVRAGDGRGGRGGGRIGGPGGERDGGRGFTGPPQNALFVRDLGELSARMIPGTDVTGIGGANPFFSWDGSAVVYRAPGTGVMRVSLSGGAATRVAEDDPRFLGGAWGPDGTILLAFGDGIYRTSVDGAPLERITAPAAETDTFRAPVILPNGRVAIYVRVDNAAEAERIDAIDLRSREERTVVDNAASVRFVSPGYLLFARGTTLMASAFDAERAVVSGEPVVLQQNVQRGQFGFPLTYNASASGTLVYVPFLGDNQPDTLAPVFVSRSGQELGPVLSGTAEPPIGLHLSPDASRLAMASAGLNDRALWIHFLDGRPPIRLIEKGLNQAPLWSPDGRLIVFETNTSGVFDLHALPADGSTVTPEPIRVAPPQVVLGLPTRFPHDWLPDGRLVFSDNGSGSFDILANVPRSSGEPTRLQSTSYVENGPRISPDGRWLAYSSNRTGAQEIWVQAVDGGAASRVSLSGGNQALWSRDGRELFFRQTGKVMAVRVRAGAVFQFDPAVELFERPYLGNGNGRTWDVMPDGRFIMIPQAPPTGPQSTPGFVVVQNVGQVIERLLTSSR